MSIEVRKCSAVREQVKVSHLTGADLLATGPKYAQVGVYAPLSPPGISDTRRYIVTGGGGIILLRAGGLCKAQPNRHEQFVRLPNAVIYMEVIDNAN